MSDVNSLPPMTGVDLDDEDQVEAALEETPPVALGDTAEELEDDEDGADRTEDPS